MHSPYLHLWQLRVYSILVVGCSISFDVSFSARVKLASASASKSKLRSECSNKEKATFFYRFRVGKKYGKPCSEEVEGRKPWGDYLVYVNDDNPDLFAVYVYPKADHNGAFRICQETSNNVRRFDGVLCKRMHTQTSHYSVILYRVESVEIAMHYIKSHFSQISNGNARIKHLVLGGHGSPTSIHWGDGRNGTSRLKVGEEKTEQFLDMVYPLFVSEKPTLFLDSCLNGKPVANDGSYGSLNMAQFVAQRLSGVEVFASRVSFANSQFRLLHGKHFDARINAKHGNDAMINLNLGADGGLRDWGFYPDLVCENKDRLSDDKENKDITGCRLACEQDSNCHALVWFPSGNCKKRPCNGKRCYISSDCHNAAVSERNAMIFTKPKSFQHSTTTTTTTTIETTTVEHRRPPVFLNSAWQHTRGDTANISNTTIDHGKPPVFLDNAWQLTRGDTTNTGKTISDNRQPPVFIGNAHHFSWGEAADHHKPPVFLNNAQKLLEVMRGNKGDEGP